MWHSLVHYRVPPGCICSNTAFSPRRRVSLRLREWPLVSKCVIIVCLGTACLTGWPSDLLHLLMVPWWLQKDQTAHSCGVSKQQPAGWTTVAARHRRYECVILEESAYLTKAGGETLESDDSSCQESICDSPAYATYGIVINITRNIARQALNTITVRAIEATHKITPAEMRIDTSKLSSD